MIERTGVQPETLDRVRPRNLDASVHQPTSRARIYQPSGYTEEAELAFAIDSEIELEDAFVSMFSR